MVSAVLAADEATETAEVAGVEELTPGTAHISVWGIDPNKRDYLIDLDIVKTLLPGESFTVVAPSVEGYVIDRYSVLNAGITQDPGMSLPELYSGSGSAVTIVNDGRISQSTIGIYGVEFYYKKADAPKIEEPKPEVTPPTTEVPKAEEPKTDITPITKVPNSEEPKATTPATEEPKATPPTTEQPKTETSQSTPPATAKLEVTPSTTESSQTTELKNDLPDTNEAPSMLATIGMTLLEFVIRLLHTFFVH